MIDGKKIAAEIRSELKQWISTLSSRKPCLAVVLVGDHAPSMLYVNNKVKACQEVGILSIRKDFPMTITQEKLLQEIDALNKNSEVDGILVQLPLPESIDVKKIIYAISPEKDVDGFHPLNVGKWMLGDPDAFVPCTPLGIKVLLEKSNIPVQGKHAVIVGRSNLVGKPLSILLLGANATVTIAHSFTQDLKKITSQADILIACLGKPKFIQEEMVKEGSVVIDVGTTKIGNQIVGDVDFEKVQKKCSYISPVPGGVGPMTIAMLLKNTLQSYKGCKQNC